MTYREWYELGVTICFGISLYLLGLLTALLFDFRKEVKEFMATLEEQLDEIKGILDEAATEIPAKLSELNQTIADLQASLGQLTPDQQTKLDAVKVAAQNLANVVPNAPA